MHKLNFINAQHNKKNIYFKNVLIKIYKSKFIIATRAISIILIKSNSEPLSLNARGVACLPMLRQLLISSKNKTWLIALLQISVNCYLLLSIIYVKSQCGKQLKFSAHIQLVELTYLCCFALRRRSVFTALQPFWAIIKLFLLTFKLNKLLLIS